VPWQNRTPKNTSFIRSGASSFRKRCSPSRRRQIALGIIGNLAQVTGGTAHGFEEARQDDRLRDEHDRVVEIRGHKGGTNPVIITGVLARPAGGGGVPSSDASQQPSGVQSGSKANVGLGPAFHLQKIEQEELKTVRLSYRRTEAVKQTYAPQGFIGILARDLGPGHFIQVDLDDPFFRTIDIVVKAPIDFDRIGLMSTHLALDYGLPTDPAGVKHKDFRFDKNSPREYTHAFFINQRRETTYRVQAEYQFDPLSGWDGEKFNYMLPEETIDHRTLTLNPFNHFGFLEVDIIPGDIDWSIIQSTEVHLHYEDPGIFSKDKVIIL